MFHKYVMRNRDLRAWLEGSTLLSTNGCELAAGILSAVAFGLRLFA